MLRKINASLSFTRETPAEKVNTGTNVINGFSNNAGTFPNPPVTIAALQQSNDTLLDATVAARSGDHVAVATLQNVEKEWDNNFRLTANYVSIVADGNEAIVRMAGLTPTKGETTPAQIPGTPANFLVHANGTKGNFNASCDAVKGAKAYVFTALTDGVSVSFNGDTMMITVGDSTAYVQVSTKRKVDFSNMPSRTDMSVGVFAVNSAGIGSQANGQEVFTK